MMKNSSLSLLVQLRVLRCVCAVLTSVFGLWVWYSYSMVSIPLQSVSYSNNGVHSIPSQESNWLRPTSKSSSTSSIQWHIKPVKPLHEGKVVYLTGFSDKDDEVVFKRIFTAPCGDGMLVFNVGPAAEYEPYSFELYDDAYAYSNNGGLCVLYPSYRGIQTSSYPLWTSKDKMEMTVSLGDLPNKISTRIVVPPHTKPFNRSDSKYPGGDYLIIRSGNFYNPTYYKHLKSIINSWPPDINAEDIPMKLSNLMATL